MKASRIVRVISLLLFGLILLFFVFDFSFKYYVNYKLVPQLKDEFSESMDKKYNLSFDKLSINLFTERISLSNILIYPSTNRKVPYQQFSIRANYFKIVDFSIFNYFSTKKLEIRGIKIVDPIFAVYLNDSNILKKLTVNNEFNEYVDMLSVNHIDIINANIYVYHNFNSSLPFFKSLENNIYLKDVSLNFKIVDKDSFLLLKKTDFNFNNITYYYPDSLYTISAKKIQVSVLNSTLIVDSVQMIPNFNKIEFTAREGYQINIIKIYSPEIKFIGFNYLKLIKEKKLEIQKIMIQDCKANVYRDNTKPLKKINRPSLQSIIKNVPIHMSIDTIVLNNGRLDFEVLNAGSNTIGKIYMNKVNALVCNITNDSSIFKFNQSVKAEIDGYVLNQAKFTESYVFPLKSNKELFYCSGTLSSMPLSAFNSKVIPAKRLLFKTGRLDDVKFNFCARENYSDGNMTFKYHGLSLEVLDLDISKKSIKEKISTLIVNRLMIHKNNPGTNGDIRNVKLHMKHNPNRYFLFYSMQTILSGIEPTILKKKR